MRTNFSCVVLYYKVPSPVNTRDPNATPKIGSPARNMTLNKVQTVDAKRDVPQSFYETNFPGVRCTSHSPTTVRASNPHLYAAPT
jgi:hypothetical protein